MSFEFEDVSGRDLPNIRSYDLGNNKLNIKRTDPYGFWVISFERGQVPASLKGQYTSIDDARKAVKTYLENKERTVVSKTK